MRLPVMTPALAKPATGEEKEANVADIIKANGHYFVSNTRRWTEARWRYFLSPPAISSELSTSTSNGPSNCVKQASFCSSVMFG
jgi:hypothetical protein